MKRLWRDLRTNFMYWRFRNITRNRLRLKSWWARRRPGARPVQSPYPPRARGMATYVSYRSGRRSWTAVLALVVVLTALRVFVDQVYVNPGLVYLVGTLIVVGAIYWALHSVV